MSVNWGDYTSFYPGPDLDRPHELLSRAAAKRTFVHLMAHKEERKAMLKALAAREGIDLTGDDDSIQALNDWLWRNVCRSADGKELAWPWYSVCNDIGLFLGDELIRRAPHLRWTLYIWGKKNVSYHRAVVMGFTRTPERINTDFDRVLVGLCLRVTGGGAPDRDLFLGKLRSALSWA
jgi:hypothetical protein